MDDHSVWAVIKDWIMYPAYAIAGWYFTSQQKEIKQLKEDVSTLKINQAISVTQIESIKEDIRDLSKVIKNAEQNILDYLKK